MFQDIIYAILELDTTQCILNFSENLQCVVLCSQVFAQLMGRKSWKTSRKESNLFLVQGELKDHEELWMLPWEAITLYTLDLFRKLEREVLVQLKSLCRAACVRP